MGQQKTHHLHSYAAENTVIEHAAPSLPETVDDPDTFPLEVQSDCPAARSSHIP